MATWFVAVACCMGICTQARTLKLDKKFYFLVSTSIHIQASTHWVEWCGGAGYLLQYKDRDYIVYSVYLEEKDAISVQTALTDTETKMLLFSVDKLYFYQYAQKKNFEKIKGAFHTFYSCLLVLENIINQLSQGATQESGKYMLQILQKQLDFLNKSYTAIAPQYAIICQKGEEKIIELLRKTVFLKDLRYLFCELCVGYIHFADTFCI